MLAAISIPTLLLLASVAVAQDDTPSVATSPFVSPTPESEALYTIQTQTATGDVDPWSCYMECVQPPCPACKYTLFGLSRNMFDNSRHRQHDERPSGFYA
jgi:hypothetical protein